MIPDSVNKFAREGCDAAETLQKVQCDAFCLQNRTPQATDFDDDFASIDIVAIAPTNLNIDRRIDLAENFGSGSGASNNRFFARNDASGCTQRLRHKKVSRNIAVADVFFKCGDDRVVRLWLHRLRSVPMINANRDWVYYSYTRVETPSSSRANLRCSKAVSEIKLATCRWLLLNQTKKDSGSAR